MAMKLLIGFIGIVALVLAMPVARGAEQAATQPALPVIGEKTFNVTEHGAVGDGKTLNTDAIAKAIKACVDGGGGIVVVPAGKFLSGPIQLASKVNLRIDEGATLIFTDAAEAYPIDDDNRHQMMLSAKKCEDVAITGKGTIDGQGARWWEEFLKIKGKPDEKKSPRRPNLVDLTNCTRVLIKDVQLVNSPNFHLVPRDCDEVTIDGVKINAPEDAPNTDGIDPSGRNYLITRCVFDVGDDCIAFKPQRVRPDGRPACENFVVSDCTFLHGHGLSIGGQTAGGMRNLVVRDCTFDGTDAGIRMKAPRGQGGVVENLSYENITMTNVKVPIFITSYYPNNTTPKEPENDKAQPVGATTPTWRKIRITNVKSQGSPEAGRIFGLPEMPVSDVVFTHVNLTAEEGLHIANAKGVQFRDCQIKAAKGEAVIQRNAEVSGLPASE